MLPTPPVDSFWTVTQGPALAQGAYVTACPFPVFPADYGQSDEGDISIRRTNLIVVTQSCDLENNKTPSVSLCQIYTLDDLKRAGERFSKPDHLEQIRKGLQPALHMLSSPTAPADNQDVRIVDFRAIHSLPVVFLQAHAQTLGPRWRLKSPYLEHFSQALARFFMRVGLPSAIPKFK